MRVRVRNRSVPQSVAKQVFYLMIQATKIRFRTQFQSFQARKNAVAVTVRPITSLIL